MDLISREELRELAETRDSVCVSLYMPTYRFESELAQNPIRLKNLIREVRHQLKASGIDDQTADAVVQPAIDLLGNDDYWFAMSDGFAAFLSPDSARFFRLPVQFGELAVHNARFHLTPLFPLIAANHKFYMLALSQNDVRLYQCTPYTISEVEASEIPQSMRDALWMDDPTANRTTLGLGPRLRRVIPEATHSVHGIAPEDVVRQPHDDLHRFFQQVDNGLIEAIGEDTAPLILACVEYYLPIYRGVNNYPGLVTEQMVAGNPDYVNPKQLHEKAWEIVRPMFEKAREQAVAQFEQLYNKDGGLASDNLKEIIPAAVFSRIDTLFVPVGRHAWGRYDPDSNAFELHEGHGAGVEDLLDLAAVHTYLNGGTVHAVEEINMPVKNAVAATFRYAAQNMEASEK